MTGRDRSRGTWRGMRLLRRWWSRVVRPIERTAPGSGVPAGCGGPNPAAPGRSAAVLAQRRAEAMRRLYPKLSSWNAAPTYIEQLTATYAGLAAAVDLDDLESRLRQIEPAASSDAGARDRTLSFC
jgi:hypothetical protein